MNLCFNPTMAAEVTLQPVRRFDLDAAILFADILLIPDALGQTLTFAEGEGPRLKPVMSEELLEEFRDRDILEHLAPIFETVRLTRKELAEDKALIGFAGAPWTVATYMLAGQSSKDPAALRARYYENPAFVTGLIDLLTDKTIGYLLAQIEAGADAIQIFDTWAAGLPVTVLDALSVRPLEKISKALKAAHPDVPIILFPKGVGEKAIDYAMIKECDGFGIDYAMDPGWARGNLSDHVVVQGGLDPLVVTAGGEDMRRAAKTLLDIFHDVAYVFNLGHGFIPQTPPAHVGELVEFIRSKG